MEKDNNQSLKSVLSQLFQEYKLNEGFLSAQAKDTWVEILGNRFNKYVADVFVKERILFVKITSPILRKEFELGKSLTLNEIHQTMKNSFIQEIRYL